MNRKLNIVSPKPRKKSLDQVLEETLGSNFFTRKKVAIIGICGGQACGKTKIAQYFHKKIPHSAIISEKDFFKIEKINRNFSPEEELLFNDADGYPQERIFLLRNLSNQYCYDHEGLISTLEKLRQEEKVSLPSFNEEKGCVLQNFTELDPKKSKMIFVEGYFIYNNQKLCELFDLKMFTEVDDDVRLSRMILKENQLFKNPNTIKTFFVIYENYLKNSFNSSILPNKRHANILLPNYDVNESGEIEMGDATLEFLITNLKNIK